MTDAYMAHKTHADSALPTSPQVQPPPPLPWWRHPATHLAAGLVVLGLATVAAVQLTTALQPLDLIATPACVNGSYVVSWGLPGDRYYGVEVRSPKDAVEQTSIEGYKVRVVLRGTATGDVRAVVDVEGGGNLLAGTPHRWTEPAADSDFYHRGCCDRVPFRAPLAQLAEQLALN